MKVMPLPLQKTATVAERRWRSAAIIGLLVFLALVVYAAVGLGHSNTQAGFVQVLVATTDIRPGTTITAGELGVTQISAADSSVLATLIRAGDRDRLVGQTAVVGVARGHIIPDNVVAPQVTAGLWEANLPIRRMPSDLHAGDHVALIVTGAGKAGQEVQFVVMQDVTVITIGSGFVDLWLPPKVVPQMEWYSDHGGIVLVRMQPGAVQQDIQPGGAGG
jgi:hypothetical protein